MVNPTLRYYVAVVFVNMAFSEEDKILTKPLRGGRLDGSTTLEAKGRHLENPLR